jgi:hypothetical protein
METMSTRCGATTRTISVLTCSRPITARATNKQSVPDGAIETDEKMAADLAGPGYHINRSNLLVLESKADMQKRGQASPDDGDARAPNFVQARVFRGEAHPVALKSEAARRRHRLGSSCGTLGR